MISDTLVEKRDWNAYDVKDRMINTQATKRRLEMKKKNKQTTNENIACIHTRAIEIPVVVETNQEQANDYLI